MKKIITFLCIAIGLASCTYFDKPELSESEKLELIKTENDSIMIVFDSLMELKVEIPQLIDSTFISMECLEQFNKLARETGGNLKVISSSKFVAKIIGEIIETYALDNTDFMIIIDKTSSMADDLDNIKIGLNQILEAIKSKQNIRLSVSTYGDKNIDGPLWYDFQNFETDFEGTMKFIENIQMTHGGDFPESVYDGIYEAFQEGFWISDSKRIVILLGDAPSLDSTLSTHNEEEIIALAKQDEINMNFYPIVLSPYDGTFGFGVPKMQNLTFIESVYPNPTNGPLNVRLNQFGTFTLELFNQNGELIVQETISSDKYTTELYDYPSGLYILRIWDENKNYDTRKIILNK
jgi:hypothetical protein